MMSGMRKPSPISISSPRETMTSPSVRQFGERQEDGRGVVVDGDRGHAEESVEEAGGVGVALAAASGGEVVFQVGVAGEGLPAAQRSASQIGVQNDAGRIDDASQGGLLQRGRARRATRSSAVAPFARAAENLGAHLVDHSANFGDQERVRIARGGMRRGGRGPRGPRASRTQFLASVHEFDGTRRQSGAQQMVYWQCSGRGSAWLERLVRDQEVGGSNPLAPTNLIPLKSFIVTAAGADGVSAAFFVTMLTFFTSA